MTEKPAKKLTPPRNAAAAPSPTNPQQKAPPEDPRPNKRQMLGAAKAVAETTPPHKAQPKGETTPQGKTTPPGRDAQTHQDPPTSDSDSVAKLAADRKTLRQTI